MNSDMEGLRELVQDLSQKTQGLSRYAQIINESEQKLKTLDLLSEDISAKLENLNSHQGAIEQATQKADRLQFSMAEAEARIKELTVKIDQANQTEKNLASLLSDQKFSENLKKTR